jgi:hypothetical protein
MGAGVGKLPDDVEKIRLRQRDFRSYLDGMPTRSGNSNVKWWALPTPW